MPDIPFPIIVGATVTIGFIVLGVFSKALSKSKWSWDDLHLGMDAALTTLSGAGVYGFELYNQGKRVGFSSAEFQPIYDLQLLNFGWLILSIIVLFAIAVVHMHWEKQIHKPYWRFFVLQTASIFGFGLLFAFIFFVKKGI